MKVVIVLLSLVFIISCGKKSDEPRSESATDMVEVNLTGNDQMQYNLKEIEVGAGVSVKLTLKHIGQMSKDIMGHNFVLLKMGTNLDEFAAAAISAKEYGFIPQSKKDQIIAYTKIVGGGESTTIEFNAPSQPGSYKFLCTFPGHYVMMQGDFIVK